MLPRTFIRCLGVVVFLAMPLSAQLTLACSQPCGNGSFRLLVTGATPSAELFNLISLTPHTPTGGGPIFGLGLAGSGALLSQIISPLETHPFHVSATAAGSYNWEFCFPPNIPLVEIEADVVSIRFGMTGVQDVSSVVNITAWF